MKHIEDHITVSNVATTDLVSREVVYTYEAADKRVTSLVAEYPAPEYRISVRKHVVTNVTDKFVP